MSLGGSISWGSEDGWLRLRGRRMSMVMQDPKYSLNPVSPWAARSRKPIGFIAAPATREAKRRALAMLEAVQIREPERVYHLYPHQLSGGMGQRVDDRHDADRRARSPDRRRADLGARRDRAEPGLAILDDLVAQRGMGLIFISHNLDLVSSFCDRVLVMYGGRIVEEMQGRASSRTARHPYTRALIDGRARRSTPEASLRVVKRDPAWLA